VLDYAKHIRIPLSGLVILFAIFLLAVDGGVSPADALDRWVGTAEISSEGVTFPVTFTVLVNPGVGASWEWRYLNRVLGSGPLAATVSGSRVTGQLFLTGGLAFDPTSIFLPCSFRGTLTGNQVQGTFDEAPCGGTGTFLLTKQ
jgi:hypothetical protein